MCADRGWESNEGEVRKAEGEASSRPPPANVRFPLQRVAGILLLAVVYYTAGKLGLLLAAPPGHATAVWPGSGIALASSLIWGNGVWPGIWLGSFFLNLSTALDSGGYSGLTSMIAGAACIGVGAVLEALVGAFLIRRFVGYPTPLIHERQIIRLLLLGGPVSCLVGATVGVTALFGTGSLTWGNCPSNWWTWWIGDTLGVLVFTPLILIWTVKERGMPPVRQIFVSLPLVVSFCLAVLLFLYSSTMEKERIQLQFEKQADNLAQVLMSNIRNYVEVLHSIQGFYGASQSVDRQEFHNYVGHFLERWPGIQALEWIPLVRNSERAAYEDAARKEGYPTFQITERAAQQVMVRAEDREEYFPVYYVEPYKGNELALGFDLASNKARLEALSHSRDTGKATATGRVTLVQEKGEQYGFLVFAPIFKAGVLENPMREPRESCHGFALGVFRIGDILNASLTPRSSEDMEIHLYDTTASEGERLLYDSEHYHNKGPTPRKEVLSSTVHAPGRLSSFLAPRVVPVEVADRTWLIELSATGEYEAAARSWQTWFVLAGGLLGAGLLGAYFLVVTGHTARVEEEVELRTAELQRINEELHYHIAEREVAEHALEKARDELEVRVVERTCELEETHRELINKAVEAGRAQLSAMVLHNIGNAITPARVYLSETNTEELDRIAVYMEKSYADLVGRMGDLQYYVTEDPRGREVFSYLGELTHSLCEATRRWAGSLAKTAKAVDYISEAVTLQQEYAAGELETKELVNLNGIVEDAVRMQEGALERRGIAVRRDLAPDLPKLLIDKNRLMQVVVNVVKNAYEAIDELQDTTREKQIVFRSCRVDDGVELTIQDSGIGIEPNEIQSLFELGKSHKGSSGFGLYYCRKFVETNGGSIGIISEGHSGGTEVCVYLPIARG